LLASPVFAVSILLLIVNDHVLKAAWPGLVTGKLSDICERSGEALFCAHRDPRLMLAVSGLAG
jgi:hypothetical protein